MSISFAVLKEKNALKIFSGQLISQVCDKMMTLGLVWVISGSGSLRQVPWFLAAGALPHLMLARWAGLWVAKFGPLKTVIWTDVIRGIIFLIACGIWLWAPPARTAILPILFFVTVFANSASAFFNPAIMSLPMSLAGDKPQSLVGQLTAMVDSCFSAGNILGPVMVAILFPYMGLTGLFLLNGLSYLLAAGLEAAIVLPTSALTPEIAPEAAPVSDTKAARVAFTQDSLLHFMLSAFFCMNLVLTPMFAFLPLFARFQYQGNINTLATLEIALGLGTVIGGFMLTVFTGKMKTGMRTILGSLAVAASYLFFSFNHNAALGCVALFVLGLCLSIVNISLLTLFQVRPNENDVPKVMSYVNLITVGALPFSMALIGGFIEKINIQTLAVVCASIFLLLTLITTLNSELRKV